MSARRHVSGMDQLHDVPYFDRFAPFYDRLMPAADEDTLSVGLALAERELRRVVDAGGGSGRGIRALSVPEPTVLDASRPMLRQARSNGLSAVQADAASLPLATASVDAVLVVDALHHMGAIDDVLAEAARALRPGGVLVVREFNPATLRGRALSASEHLLGFHSTFLTPEELAARVEAAGLDPAIPDRGWAYTVAGVKGTES